MSRYFALALEASPIQTKNKPRQQINKSTNWGIWVVALLVILSVVYLWQVNSLTTKGYEIRTLERKIVELKEQQKRLELESASLQSIQRIEEASKTLNLVPSKQMDFPKQNGYAYEDILSQQ